MRRYFGRKLLIYMLTFFLAVTIDWMIPRFMPGDPIQTMLAQGQSARRGRQGDVRLITRKPLGWICPSGSSTSISGMRFSTATWEQACTVSHSR